MRILHVGIPNYALSKSFAKVGEYKFFDWTDWTAIPGNEANLRRKSIETSAEFNPDITFFQLQNPDPYDGATVKQMRGFKINWSWDVREPLPKWFLDVATGVDTTCFTNEYDVEQIRSCGFRADFLQNGFDADTFTPDGSMLENVPEIVFMGNHYDETYNFPLSDFREKMVRFLGDKYGSRFAVYGFGWNFRTDCFVHREQKEAAAYRTCKIAINVSHYELERYTSDRMFRMMGSGAFCLCKWYPGVEKDFVDGVHIKTWKTLDELHDLIEYYLQHPEERMQIAKTGCELVRSNYTLDNLVEKIIALKNDA
jgi:hypothetical protein